MPNVTEVFWRQVTDGDFWALERSPEHDPASGGGQTYFDIPLGDQLTLGSLRGFLGLGVLAAPERDRGSKKIEARVLETPSISEEIEFMPRLNDGRVTRFRIARQKRQRPTHVRHPAWTSRHGFPSSPDDVNSKTDPRVPDLSLLKLIVVRTDEDTYFAGFTNDSARPAALPAEFDVLFRPNARVPADGIITPASDTGLSLDDFAAAVKVSNESRNGRPTSPEIEDVFDQTALKAGSRPKRGGQGFRQSADARIALESHSMRLATEYYEAAGWRVEDVSVNHSYDLRCSKDGRVLRVEVKGTTSDGAAVLLTPNEVELARNGGGETALFIVHDIGLATDEAGLVTCAGGTQRIIEPWKIDDHGELQPTGFTYALH